jgi:hypothetical protein
MTTSIECSYAEFHDLFIIVLNVVMLSVVMLSVVILSVVMLSVIMLSLVMLNVVMLIVRAAKICLCFGGFTNFLIDCIDGAVSSSTFIAKWVICQDGWFLT